MAGRKPGYQHLQKTRDKIQAAQLINRMQLIALGEVEADATQVNAAKALLAKVLPDLKAVEHSGDADNPLTHRHHVVEQRIVDPNSRDA
jgi:hypothetical protein